jgi:pimeloyl-ACP methyl ester carboxylesterase
MFRRAVLTGVGIALGALVMAAPAVGAPSKITWSKCFGGPVQCALVQVPLDYDNPGGTQIQLALARLPASDPEHRIGSLFLNPGGPGGSGVAQVVFDGEHLFTDEVRARYDLVGFDPRGVASSTGVRCFGSERQLPLAPFPFPTTDEEVATWIETDHAVDARCAQRASRLISHMSTANVARDMDRLRALVGDANLHYDGVSYGSYLGTTYANLFPERVGRMVIDGVLDPIAWSTGEPGTGSTVPFSTRVGSGAATYATLQEFFRLCDEAGPDCAFSGGAAERFAALGEQLKAAPVPFVFPDGSEGILDYPNLIGLTLGAMYYSPDWKDFAEGLAAAESAAPAATIGARLARFAGAAGYINHRGLPRYYNFVENFPAVACADSDNPGDYAAWISVSAAQDVAAPLFGRPWTWFSSICADWPFTDADRYMGPFATTPEHPMLVVGNLSDPATPYAGAQKVAGLLAGSRLLTLDAWGHTSLFLSSCADAAIGAYLVDGTLPAPGTVCAQDAPIFNQ